MRPEGRNVSNMRLRNGVAEIYLPFPFKLFFWHQQRATHRQCWRVPRSRLRSIPQCFFFSRWCESTTFNTVCLSQCLSIHLQYFINLWRQWISILLFFFVCIQSNVNKQLWPYMWKWINKTGKSLNEWRNIIAKKKLPKHNKAVKTNNIGFNAFENCWLLNINGNPVKNISQQSDVQHMYVRAFIPDDMWIKGN